MLDPKERPKLFDKFQAKLRLSGRSFKGFPLLDALPPIVGQSGDTLWSEPLE